MLGTFTMKTEQDQRLLEDTEDEVCPRVVACQSPGATLRIHLVIAIIYGGLATITMVVFVAGAASQPCTSRWFCEFAELIRLFRLADLLQLQFQWQTLIKMYNSMVL